MEKVIKRVEMVTPTPPKVTKVAAYARVSSGKDTMLQSLATQVSYYSDLIQGHPGWMYCGVYSDEAVTGTKADRAGFLDMIADCRSGAIDMIITKSISRFARNTLVLLETVRELKALGIDVFFEEQNIHTLSGDGELMLTILAGYAEEESRSVSENMKWRVRKNFEEGIPWNCTMLGYRFSEDHFVVVPEEADVVRFIFQEYLNGNSLNAIAKLLNANEIPTRRGNRWCTSSVSKLLKNTAYTGNLLLQTYYTESYLRKVSTKNNGELPMYRAENTHEAIIDLDTFNAVQKRLQQREETNSNTGKKQMSYPFTSLIACDCCGMNYRRKMTATGPVWICGTFNLKGKAFCASKAIPERVLFELTSDIRFDELGGITACNGNRIVLNFRNGTTEDRYWKDRSRSESWTPEMRKAARDRQLRRNGNA